MGRKRRERERQAEQSPFSLSPPRRMDGHLYLGYSPSLSSPLESDGGDFQARRGAIPTRERAQVSPILNCGVIDSLIEASRIQPPQCTALPRRHRDRPPVRQAKEDHRGPTRFGRGGAQNVGAVGRLRVRGAKLKGDWIERADFGRILLIRTFFSFGRQSDRSTDRPT